MLAIAVVGGGLTAYDTYQTYQNDGAVAAGKSAAIGAAVTAATGGAGKILGSIGKRIASFLGRRDATPDLPDGLNAGDDVQRRTTRAGDPAVRITREDGTVIDISPERVKEYVPNTHPSAPPGTMDQVKFDNALPGSKGKKREPTESERNLLDSTDETSE